MELIVIGSGTVAPSAERTAPAHWVSAASVRLLMDCGAGTLHRAAGLGVPWAEVTHIAITHFHADHWGELPHLLLALRWGTLPPRRAPLTVLGPVGIAERLEGYRAALGDWVTDPGYPLDVREIVPGIPTELGTGVSLDACRTPHTPHSLALSVSNAGSRLIYTGDTGPSPALAAWAHACDLLLTECSLPDNLGIATHLTPTQAGQLAKDAGARQLVLTHFYPQIEGTDPAGVAGAVYDGPITAARDGDRFALVDSV